MQKSAAYRGVRKNRELILVTIVLGVLLLFLNFSLPVFMHDDLSYLERVNRIGYMSATRAHYFKWSSRIIIEFVLMFLSQHFMLWKILNSAMMFLAVIIICKYVFDEIDVKSLLLTFGVYCLIPFAVMSEAGWIATSLNYLWVATFALCAFYPFYQRIKKQKINLLLFLLSILSLFFAANQEQVNLCFFVLTLLVSGYLWITDRYDYKLLILTIISALNLIFTLTTPGNYFRIIKETKRWFPAYKNLGIVNKLDMGIASFGKSFFFNFNPQYFVLFLLVAIVGYVQIKSDYIKLFSFLPLIFNLVVLLGKVVPVGFIYANGGPDTPIWSTAKLDARFSQTGTHLSLHYPGTWGITLIIILLLLSMCVSLFEIFQKNDFGLLAVVLMLMAFFSRVMIGFSPTVWASGHRTFYVIFIVTVILTLKLYRQSERIFAPSKSNFIRLTLTVIGFCTLFLTVLNK